MSFSARSLHRVRAAAPDIPDGLPDAVPPARGTATDGCPPGVGIAGPGIRILRTHPEYVASGCTGRATGCTSGP